MTDNRKFNKGERPKGKKVVNYSLFIRQYHNISITFIPQLVEKFDEWYKKNGFANRSEAIRFLMNLAVMGFLKIED